MVEVPVAVAEVEAQVKIGQRVQVTAAVLVPQQVLARELGLA